MNRWIVFGALVAFLTFPLLTSPAAQAEEELTPAQQEAVRKAVERYLKEQGMMGGGMTEIPQPAAGAPPTTDEKRLPKGKRLEELSKAHEQKKYGSTMEGSGSLIYARPFVASPKALLGGYFDFEYVNRDNQGISKFDQHRFVPFIYGDVSDHVKFAAELEIEHGGLSSSGGSEVKVEFATLDYLVNDPVNFRAGIILLPLGKFNLLHDAPLRDLTDRPLVNQRIIPTTLFQPGVGLYGTFYPTALSQLNYEIYVTNGFTNAFGGSGNPGVGSPAVPGLSNITTTNGIRSARNVSTDFDNNRGKAVVGRIAFSPLLGVEVGGSGFFGSYDPGSKRPLSIWAVDWTLQRGPFELIGEAAWAYIKDNHLNSVTFAATGNPRRMQGYYVQLNYHFLPQWLTNLAPSHFRQEISTLTAIARWEQMNLGQDLNDATEAGKRGQRQRLTLGLNFRPTEDTVIKTDFQYSPEEVAGKVRIHDTAFLASVASYF